MNVNRSIQNEKRAENRILETPTFYEVEEGETKRKTTS